MRKETDSPKKPKLWELEHRTLHLEEGSTGKKNIFQELHDNVQIMKNKTASHVAWTAALTPHTYQITTPSSPKPQIVASWFSREAKNVRFASRSESILNLPLAQHSAKINQVSMFKKYWKIWNTQDIYHLLTWYPLFCSKKKSLKISSNAKSKCECNWTKTKSRAFQEWTEHLIRSQSHIVASVLWCELINENSRQFVQSITSERSMKAARHPKPAHSIDCHVYWE